MLKKISTLLTHLVMLALVCAIAAYWVLKIVTPAPPAAPPPVAVAAPRAADPILAARMFGLVQTAPLAAASNIQLGGVFSAGKDSSAILAVDGKPGRVVLLGQSVAAGIKLAEVRRDGVTLDNNGVRQDLRLPLRTPVAMGGPPPPAGFTREGNTLAAPSAGAPSAPMTGLRAPSVPPAGFPVPANVPPGGFPTTTPPLRPLQPPVQEPAESALPQNAPGAHLSPTQ
ncbi:MAG: type II secretion system protein N [Gemmatimonadota bacterium]